MKLVLPFPPSVNQVWRNGRLANGQRKMMLSEKGRSYRWQVASDLGAQGFNPGRDYFDGEIGVSVELYPGDARRRDIDNYQKAAFDALTAAGVWEDDSQIKVMLVMMHESDKDQPRCEIEILPLAAFMPEPRISVSVER